jgi:hypothetical protein
MTAALNRQRENESSATVSRVQLRASVDRAIREDAHECTLLSPAIHSRQVNGLFLLLTLLGCHKRFRQLIINAQELCIYEIETFETR